LAGQRRIRPSFAGRYWPKGKQQNIDAAITVAPRTVLTQIRFAPYRARQSADNINHKESFELKSFSTVAELTLLAGLGVPAEAQSPRAWMQAGMLRCVVNPGIGLIRTHRSRRRLMRARSI
jgi:hypothetical protein